MGSDCSPEKTSVGWYDATEVSTPHSPFVAEIVAELDGRSYSARTVYSPPMQLYASHKTRADEAAAISETINRANKALIEQLEVGSE